MSPGHPPLDRGQHKGRQWDRIHSFVRRQRSHERYVHDCEGFSMEEKKSYGHGGKIFPGLLEHYSKIAVEDCVL